MYIYPLHFEFLSHLPPHLTPLGWYRASVWVSLFSSVQLLSQVWLSATPRTATRQASLSITNSGAYSNSCPHWVSDALQPSHPSVVPFSSHPQSFPVSGSFLMSQFFESGDPSIGVSALVSVLPMNTQDWFPLGLTGWISLQSKGLSRVFSNTTVLKHQLFNAQLSFYSNCHIHTYYWKNHSFD